MRRKQEHGFTSVDQQPDPGAWVAVLDKLRAEPFYIAYKHRALELLDPHPGRLYLDVGGGTGADARALASSAACSVVCADGSVTMAAVCRARARIPVVVCDAAGLPFKENTFDGARSDRTFQHLLDPGRALAEMVRVSKSGAHIVIVDPDYETQTFEFPDHALARKVLRYRTDHMLRNGSIAHRMAGMFHDAGLGSIRVEPLTMVVRDPTAVDNVMGLRTWARTAALNDYISVQDAERWESLYDQAVASGTFLYAVTFFITAGTKR